MPSKLPNNIPQLQYTIGEKERTIKSLESQIFNLHKKIKYLQSTISYYKKEVGDQQTRMYEDGKELIRLRSELKQSQTSRTILRNSTKANIKTLEIRLGTIQEKCVQKDLEIHDLRNQLENQHYSYQYLQLKAKNMELSLSHLFHDTDIEMSESSGTTPTESEVISEKKENKQENEIQKVKSIDKGDLDSTTKLKPNGKIALKDSEKTIPTKQEITSINKDVISNDNIDLGKTTEKETTSIKKIKLRLNKSIKSPKVINKEVDLNKNSDSNKTDPTDKKSMNSIKAPHSIRRSSRNKNKKQKAEPMEIE